MVCAANIGACGTCFRTECPACAAQHAAVAGPGHNHFACRDATCPACLQLNCAACAATHQPASTDMHGGACCPQNSAPCGRCGKLVRHDAAHAGTDTAGHNCCWGTAISCPGCGEALCNAQCVPAHYLNAGCGHANVCKRLICAGCNQCATCAGALVRDLCNTCLTLYQSPVQHLKVVHQRAPGSLGLRRRPVAVVGQIVSAGTSGRKTPPAPLASGKVDDEDIGELKQYDRGHLVALELSGVDHGYQIVPMIREFNQTGKWRKTEIAIGKLINGVTQKAINGTDVDPNAAIVSPASFTLTAPNTLNVVWYMDVYVYYEDAVGDSRIPVWFYVRLLRGNQVVTHFSVGNRCGKAVTMPTHAEVLDFMAAKKLYALVKAGGTLTKAVTRFWEEYKEPASATPPNQLLQFMHDLNDFGASKGKGYVFKTFVLETIGPSTAYKTFQRSVFKKYNRWKNNGLLLSDVNADDLYPGEQADKHLALSECGGRNAPEIDHIQTSRGTGMNSYINGRLVSFYHNHIYRDKQSTGAREVSAELLERYQRGVLKFQHGTATLAMKNGNPEIDPGVAQRTSGRPRSYSAKAIEAYNLPPNAPKQAAEREEDQPFFINAKQDLNTLNVAAFLNAHFSDAVLFKGPPKYAYSSKASGSKKVTQDEETVRDWPYDTQQTRDLVEARKGFLVADQSRLEKLAIESQLEPAYKSTHASFEAGCASFINGVGHAGRADLIAKINAAGIPLCEPSDRLNPAGGIIGALVDDVLPVITEVQAKAQQAYKDVFAAAEALGLITAAEHLAAIT